MSILQAECSLTQVLDFPRTGRQFLEEIIRENLDIGRPDRVQLIFDRRVTRRTPGTFRTRVLTEGVVPTLYAQYKHTKIKQYHKEGRALRTETTINDTYDFAIGRALCLFVLLPAGFANADLREFVADLLDQDPATDNPGRMTYDLRRLRLHGLIDTDEGLRIALFFTRGHARFFRTGLALNGPLPSGSAPRVLIQASHAIDQFLAEAKRAA